MEKIRKSRCALDGASGLGINKMAFTLVSCIVISWAVIKLIPTFGSETWTSTENDKKLKYAGRRIQRFPKLDPPTVNLFTD